MILFLFNNPGFYSFYVKKEKKNFEKDLFLLLQLTVGVVNATEKTNLEVIIILKAEKLVLNVTYPISFLSLQFELNEIAFRPFRSRLDVSNDFDFESTLLQKSVQWARP